MADTADHNDETLKSEVAVGLRWTPSNNSGHRGVRSTTEQH